MNKMENSNDVNKNTFPPPALVIERRATGSTARAMTIHAQKTMHDKCLKYKLISWHDGTVDYYFPHILPQALGHSLYSLYGLNWISKENWDKRNAPKEPTGEITQGPAPTCAPSVPVFNTKQVCNKHREYGMYTGLSDTPIQHHKMPTPDQVPIRYTKVAGTGAATSDGIPPGTTVWVSPLANLHLPNPLRIKVRTQATPETYIITELEHKPIEKGLWAEGKYIFTNEAEYTAHLREIGKLEKEYFHHFKDDEYQGTVYGIYKGDMLQLSLAMCSPSDTFTKKIGRELARKRFTMHGPLFQCKYDEAFEECSRSCFFNIYARIVPQLFDSYNLPSIKNDNQKTDKPQG